jgi:DNA end-binding protein Ku
MARPYWSGQISISLVSFSVKLFVATEAKSQIAFHQINRATGERVRYQKVNASAAEAQSTQQDSADDTPAAAPTVRNDEIVKGYEYQKGQYVTIEPSELANLRVPSKHSMEVSQFVDEADIDPEYYEKPYFVVPENDSQTQAFAVVRQALLDTRKVALSKIAFAGREHVVAITPAADGGLMAYTMRYAEELRDPKDYFRDIKKVEIDDDSLDLAKQLIERKAAKFDPSQFVDGYEVAVKELVQAKIDHAPIPHDQPAAPPRGKVVSLMDALRKSIGDDASPATQQPEPKKKPVKGITLVKSAKPAVAQKKTAKPPRRKSA